MPHSYTKVWIHAIWTTKERLPLISNSIEKKVYQLIFDELYNQNCMVKIINGMPNHIHCLFLLNPQKSIAEVIKHAKGHSSNFINQNNLIHEKFAWQTGYSAFSISESAVEKVYQYIKIQKLHHQKKSFGQELDKFLTIYGLTREQ